jgi:hypothetical protein
MVATVVVALHGGAHQRARVRAVLDTGKGANEAEHVRGAKTNPKGRCGGGAELQRGPPRWSGGGGAPACMVRPQGLVTAYRT